VSRICWRITPREEALPGKLDDLLDHRGQRRPGRARPRLVE
jgi:hypothetical protein